VVFQHLKKEKKNETLYWLYKLLACEVEKYDLMKSFVHVLFLPLGCGC